MSTSAIDFLHSAEVLASGNDEIDWRNAMSRAYYCAFHAASVFIENRFPDPNSHLHFGSHERLAERYKSCTCINNGKSISYVLSYMKRQRHVADYRLGADIRREDAIQQIDSTKRLISTFIEATKNEEAQA